MVIVMLSGNIQYEVVKVITIIDSISPGNEILILNRTYAGRELLSIAGGMVTFNHFAADG